MRNLKNKLQPAVFNSWKIIYFKETWKSYCNQQYLIYDAKAEKPTGTSSI